MPSSRHITIASRESPLALWQARFVRDRLSAAFPDLRIDILGMSTEGDRRLGSSLAKIGGKGLFVKELESALVEQRADIAVHSMKDVPMDLLPGFAIMAITAREDPRDAFVSNHYPRLSALPQGGRIGTSSLRRESQLRAYYPKLAIAPLRGNVQTRLRKLDEGQYAAIILAAAGLIRLGLRSRITAFLEPEDSLPAPGQGALGIECRESRGDLAELLAALNDPVTAWCVRAERSVSRSLAGSCTVPLGAFAQVDADGARLRGFVASPDGSRLIAAEQQCAGINSSPDELGRALAEQLIAQGAREILGPLL
ncbi:MAG: hydroxymethylbilane synthase [Betaproteobacteria bacterium]